MKLKIKVTKEVLERSAMCGKENGNISSNCAIAVAVRDIFHDWIVDFSIIIPESNKKYSIKLPSIAKDFIRKFDRSTPERRREMNPIEFEIAIDPDVHLSALNAPIEELIKDSLTLELI